MRAKLQTDGSRTKIVIAIAAATGWLASTPYIGIDHDARLYVLMAYRWLTPSAYAVDPWFAFGSQDAWSIFSPILGWVLSVFGVSSGAMVATLGQGAIFVVAAMVLSRAALGPALFGLGALALASIPIVYSPRDMLFVAEGFVSARGYAVPLSLVGVAFAIRGRWAWSAGVHALALAVHPIMALAPATVSLLARVDIRWRIRLVALGVAMAFSLILAGAAGGLPLVEGDWRYYLEPAPLIFIARWVSEQVETLSAWACVLVLGALFGGRRTRAVYALTLVVSGVGLALSFAASWVPVEIVLAAQTWRGIWFAKVIALVALVELLGRFVLRRGASFRRVNLVLAMVSVLAASAVPPAFVTAVLAVGLACRAHWMPQIEGLLRLHTRFYWLVVALVVLVITPNYVLETASRAKLVSVQGAGAEFLHGFLRNGGLGVFAYAAWRIAASRRWPLVALALFPPAIALAATWDARSDSKREQESYYALAGGKSRFGGAVLRGSAVYWHRNPESVWLELGTAGYASTTHATGMIFSKRRTEVISERLSRVVAAVASDVPPSRYRSVTWASVPKMVRGNAFVRHNLLASYEDAGNMSEHAVGFLCADPALDYVVTEQSYPTLTPAVATVGGAYLYDCSMLRGRLHHAAPSN